MSDVFMAILGGGIGAAIVSIIGSYILNRQLHRYEKEKEDSLERKALKALLHDRIYDECTRVLAEGQIRSDEYTNLLYLYQPYKELGGNGVCEKLISSVEKLTIKSGK